MGNGKYFLEDEKIDTAITLPIGQGLKAKIDHLKRNRIDFNRWARDVLKRNMHELESAIENPEPPQAA